MNLPKSLDLLLVPLEQDRVRLLGALADGQPEAVVDEIAQRVDTYFEQNQPAEALRRIDLLLSVLDRLPASRPWSAMLYSQRARALLELGRVGDARSTYRQAIDGLPESATSGAFACSLRRADGMLAAVLGDFEEALAILEDAQDQLPQNGVTDGTRLAVERARLLSNIALARYWLGDLETSAAGFGAVIELEQASGNVDGEVVNRSLLGNVLRDSGRATDALEQYDAALATLDERSYRDRESDVLSDRALALLALDRPAEALDDGRTAMLLSGPTNYALNGGRHLIAYAEALAAAGLPDAAHAVATQAYGMSRRWESLDLEWRAALVAARTAGGKDDTAERFRWLERALASVESLRTQSLPESLKIALSRGREEVYGALVEADLAAGDPVAALLHMELAKSRVLVELLAGTPLPAPPVPTELLDRERDLLEELDQVQGQRFAKVLGMAGELPVSREQLANVRSRLQGAWDEIAAANPAGADYVELRRAGQPALDTLSALLVET